MAREKDVYFAKLAEQAERYDEMASHMEARRQNGDTTQHRGKPCTFFQ